MNQSKAAARALAVKLGYYSTDPDTMWQIDSLLDYCQDDSILGVVAGYAFAPERTEEGNDNWVGAYKKMGDLLEGRFNHHGKKFIAGDKITLADFSIASLYFSHIYNDSSAFKELQGRVKECIDSTPKLKAYLEGALKTEMNPYLGKRQVCPF